MRQLTTLLLLCIVFAVPAAAASSQFKGRVVAVADGDTITVLTQDKQQVKIRLYGIDCPESRQPFGTRAGQATSKAVFGKDVTVKPVETDRYGRTVAIVLLPSGEDLNTILLREGMAWVYQKFCKHSEICGSYRQLEHQAKSEKRGLWKDANPIAPWEWRRR